MKVRELMTTNVASVPSDLPLSEAARLMWQCDCGAIPVIEAGGERVVGMITDRDICMATWSKDRAPNAILISETMSPDLFHCGAEDSVSMAESLMRSKQIRRIPVLNGDRKLIGILSLADIATKSQHNGSRSAANEPTPLEISATLANICQPRASSLS